MSIGFTTDLLLSAVRRRGMASNATANGTADADLIEYLDAELQARIVPLLLDAGGDFLVNSTDQTISSGTTSYRIPSRAIGSRVREVARVDTNGDITVLRRVPLEEASSGVGDYYIQGSNIILNSDPGSTSDVLRVFFHMRPGALVATSAVAVVSSINTGTKTITTTSTIPSAFSTSVLYDFVKATPSYETLAFDKVASVASGTTLTYTATLPTGLAAGDYVCIAQQAPVAQVPPELHPALAQRGVIKVLEAQGRTEQLENARAQLSEMEKSALMLISPRVDSSPMKIVSHSPLFSTAGRFPTIRKS